MSLLRRANHAAQRALKLVDDCKKRMALEGVHEGFRAETHEAVDLELKLMLALAQAASVSVPAPSRAATDHVLVRLGKVEFFRQGRWVGVLFTEKGDDGKRDVKFCIDADRDDALNKLFKATVLNPAFVILVLLDRERGVIDTYNHKEGGDE